MSTRREAIAALLSMPVVAENYDAQTVDSDAVGVILTVKKPTTRAFLQNASMAINAFNEHLEASGSKRLAVLIVDDSMIDVKVVQK